MTLTQWFRAYFFNPLTRALRSAQKPAPVWMVILVTQLTTMVLIGLWHGITLNFVPGESGMGWACSSTTAGVTGLRPLTARLQEHPRLNWHSVSFQPC